MHVFFSSSLGSADNVAASNVAIQVYEGLAHWAVISYVRARDRYADLPYRNHWGKVTLLAALKFLSSNDGFL
jgi:hypothetical protein